MSEAPKFKIIVDKSKCVGGGQCVVAAPNVFAQGEDDGLIVVLNDTPPPEEHEAVREATRLCPVLCISVEE